MLFRFKVERGISNLVIWVLVRGGLRAVFRP